jgi:DNA-binding CsgD family transcriptional regulator
MSEETRTQRADSSASARHLAEAAAARRPAEAAADGRLTDTRAGPHSRLVLLACLAGAAYVGLFAIIDALLEAHTPTSQQMLIRIVLVAMALLGALAILVYVLQRERAAAAAAEQRVEKARFEGALLTLRELGIKTPGPVDGGTRAGGPAPAALADSYPEVSVLTARERQVALLIARGRTTREIAEQLTITERTVDTHADRIRAKLGLRSRAEIVAWVLGKGLLSHSEG